MTEELESSSSDAAIDNAPTWLRALQAGLIGLVAGLVLHAILAMVVVQAGPADPAHAGPKECKKSSPPRDAVSPSDGSPVVTGGRWAPAL